MIANLYCITSVPSDTYTDTGASRHLTITEERAKTLD